MSSPIPIPDGSDDELSINLDDLFDNYTEEFREQYDDDDDEGESADSRGYHNFSRDPVGDVKMPMLIMHNDEDPDWLNKNLGKPPGIYSPEGYIWGRNRKEIFQIELDDGIVKSGSLSQIYALNKRPVALFKVTGDEQPDSSEPDIEGTCDDLEILKLCCGEPRPHFEMSYEADLMMIDIGGPPRLETYIPPSQLPRWLYVYDEDDITHPSTMPSEASSDIDWLASGHPLLPLPGPDVKPHKYRLVDPSGVNVQPDEPPVDPEQSHATLILSKSRALYKHDNFYEGQIALQGDSYPSMFRVVARLNNHGSKTKLLKNEAAMYNLFPVSFSKEFTGVQLVRPSRIPRRLSKVTPSFYGYYEPVEDAEENNGDDDNDQGEKAAEKIIRRSILLTEYCGHPINPRKLTQYQKLEIVSLLDRFHNAGFIHNLLSRWDIVSQPGPPERFEPLCRTPLWARTLNRPCFRIVNFENTEWSVLDSGRQRIERRHSKPHNSVTSSERRNLGNIIKMRLL